MRKLNLFLKRERLLKVGVCCISDIQQFVPCGYIRAEALFKEIGESNYFFIPKKTFFNQ